MGTLRLSRDLHVYVSHIVLCFILFVNTSRGDHGKCPPGFHSWFSYGRLKSEGGYKSTCYRFDTRQVDWYQGRRYCRCLGGDLVSIESQVEQNHLKQIISQNKLLQEPELTPMKNWGYWTSGTDLEVEGIWVWSATGTRADRFTHWARRPDNQGGREHCLELMTQSAELSWNDVDCTALRLAFICEIDAKV